MYALKWHHAQPRNFASRPEAREYTRQQERPKKRYRFWRCPIGNESTQQSINRLGNLAFYRSGSASGKYYDLRADFFSLGVFYEMMTGASRIAQLGLEPSIRPSPRARTLFFHNAFFART
jgi:hypothetical protein